MRNFGVLTQALYAFSALAWASGASAAPVNISFTGSIVGDRSAPVPPALIEIGVGHGSMATGTIVVESSVVDDFPADPTLAHYGVALMAISVSSGAWSMSTTAPGGSVSSSNIFVENLNEAYDLYTWQLVALHIVAPGTPSSVPAFDSVTLTLNAYPADVGSVGDALLPPDIDAWRLATLRLWVGQERDEVSILVHTVVVPEPSLALLVTMTAAVAWALSSSRLRSQC